MRYVYILICADQSYYTGISTNLDRRLEEHNTSAKGAKYTKARRPVQLIRKEAHDTRSQASQREYLIKKMTRSQKEILVHSELN